MNLPLETTIEILRRQLRAVPRNARNAHHQIATRRVRDAKMFMERMVLDVAWERAREAAYHVQFI